MLRPSGVSSPRLDWRAAIRQSSFRRAAHRHDLGRQPIAEGDRPRLVQQQHIHIARCLDSATDMASTLKRVTRSIPAMPIADSRPPIVVGIRHTSSAMRITVETGVPA